jgi:predicted TIM-barrel fold metal-dependent hydrolase
MGGRINEHPRLRSPRVIKSSIAAALAALLVCLPHPCLAQQPTFDLHVHLRNGAQSIDEYQAQVASAKRQVTAFGGMWFGGPNQALAGNAGQIRAHNDALLALVTKYPKMVPIATVHPYDGKAALDELKRVAGLGVRIIKIHPHTQKFDVTDPRVLTLVQRAGELDLIVLMDNANIIAGDSENLFNLALAAPKTRFIFAHMGGLEFRFWNVLALVRTAQNLFENNIYFDISATVTLAADSPIEAEFVWTLRNVGIDHVLLGSDYPQLTLPQTLDAFERLDLDPSEKAKVRYENAQRLLKK